MRERGYEAGLGRWIAGLRRWQVAREEKVEGGGAEGEERRRWAGRRGPLSQKGGVS